MRMSILARFFGRESQKPTISAEEVERQNQHRQELRDLNLLKRKLDMEIMVQEAELEKAKIAMELADIEAELGEEEDSSPESMLMGLIQKAMPQTQTAPIPKTSINAPSGAVSFTDEQIKQIWSSVPSFYRGVAKTLSDEQVKEFIKQKQPNIDVDSLNRAILIIRQ